MYEPQRYPQAGENNASVQLGVVSAAVATTNGWTLAIRVKHYLIARAGWVPDSKSVYVVRTNRVQNRTGVSDFRRRIGKSLDGL